jgi:hypothetical protein
MCKVLVKSFGCWPLTEDSETNGEDMKTFLDEVNERINGVPSSDATTAGNAPPAAPWPPSWSKPQQDHQDDPAGNEG